MDEKLFSTLYVARLKINDLFSLNKSTIEYANPVKESIGAIPAATLTQLINDNEAMGVQMNKPAKNMLTQQLVDLDQDRDDRFAEIKRNITTNIKGRDEAKKTAARNLKGFFEPYWDVDKKAMNTETGVFAEMLGKYNANEALKADAATIGIADMLTGLETANTEFDTLYKTRNSDEAQNGPSATSLKTTAAKSYEQFCTAIEQAVNFAPTDVLTTLFGQMDELRKTYAALNGRKSQEEEAPEEATETE
ncbi:DUF6261 family protein [Prolixibacter denitrificans]|uniref:Uncharacterized protein n=1 Tax=Prolixibacter denitrificans TaxID=1541063 RepID=A0A2P8C6Q0_9BACT|nr:DUF6261 family protein [Prolixibacter denitrificans]PSK80607.1 hypothetical protein CLV93_11444 [Prolixibacter denitrificans]GET22098.1 hypothetical protein JCM18694_23440 [Prolixibacter denitrificans]